MNTNHISIRILFFIIVFSVFSVANATEYDWMHDQPPTDKITRFQNHKLSTVTSFPRRSTGSLKATPSAQQLACFDIMCWKPFNISRVKEAQAINPNLVWLRIYCPQEWQGAADAADKQGSGFPFNTSGPATANNQMFAGHFAYKPYTTISADFTAAEKTITVADGSKISINQFCVIYPADSWDNAEHVKVTAKSGNTITINRAYKSVAKDWTAGSKIAVHQQGNGTTADNWCYNLSTKCPLDANGKRACDALGEWLALNYDNNTNGTPADAVCDGILYDSDAYAFVNGGSVVTRNADFDNDGVADWGYSPDGTNHWGEGLEIFYNTVRSGLDKRGKTDAIILSGVAESWGVLPNNGTQMEACWDGQFGVGGKASANYNKINFYLSGMKAQTAHGIIGPRVTDCQSKIASAIYPDDSGETRNAPVRFSYAMSMMFDGTWWSNMNFGTDAFHYFDEDAVYLTDDSNYAKSVLKTNTTDIRANNKWLGKALGQYQRIYDPALFSIDKNKLSNGNFESALSGWTGTAANATIATDKFYEGSASLLITPTIPNASSVVENAFVTSPALALTLNKEYTWCFAVYSEAPARIINVKIGALSEDLFITPGWSKHVLNWYETSNPNPNIRINVGGELTKIWFDQMYVFEGSSNVFRRDFENGIIVVNASSLQKVIPLGDSFHKIAGNLDAIVNNGEKNINSVTLAKNDGIFLVRTTPVTENAEIIVKKMIISSNPCADYCNLQLPDGTSSISIIDISGKKVFERKIAGEANLTLDVSSYPKGIYFIKCDGVSFKCQEKLLKI